MIERVGGAVRRELGRFGPSSGLEPLVERWQEAVGPEIARNAWPARLGRDGTLHVHAKDSIWAFELTSRAEEIRARLGSVAPPRLAFSPGPLPDLAEGSDERHGDVREQDRQREEVIEREDAPVVGVALRRLGHGWARG